jgi:tetratricopeptide (TPR) repeat protein
MTILSSFAEAYGRDVNKYTDLESRSRVVREVLAGKRALIVLDNAQHSYEVTPLLPPTTGTCAVIITTRRHDLTVTHGVHRCVLTPFAKEKGESLSLFNKLLGPERVGAEQAALEAIAALLGHLPLAIAIVGHRLAHEPGWTATEFLARLRREELRLRELACEDLNVQLSFNLSYDLLQPGKQRFFNTLGVFEEEGFSLEAAACISQLLPDTAHDYLRELYSLSLVQLGQHGRYKLHPLLRDYARQKMKAREVLLQRMSIYFAGQTAVNERNYTYFDLEYRNVLAALQIARQFELHATFVRGVNALYHFWETRGLYTVAQQYLRQAKRAARATGEVNDLLRTLLNLGYLMQILGKYQRAKAILHCGLSLARSSADEQLITDFLLNLGIVAFKQGDFDQSETYLLQSLEFAHSSGYEEGLIRLLLNLGVLAEKKGDATRAETYLHEGLMIARRCENREKISHFLMNLGATVNTTGKYEEAEAYFLEGLAIAQEIGHRERASLLLTNLGAMASSQKKYAEAEVYLQQGLALARKINHRERIAGLLVNLGIVAQACGKVSQAEAFCAESLQLSRALGHFWLIMATLSTQGEVYLAQKKYDQAWQSFQDSLPMAYELGAREYIALIKYGQAQIRHTLGDDENARNLGRESLAIFVEMDHTKAAEVHDWLATAGAE